MCAFQCVLESDSLVSEASVLSTGSHIVGVLTDGEIELLGIITQGSLFEQVSKEWKFEENIGCCLSKLQLILQID